MTSTIIAFIPNYPLETGKRLKEFNFFIICPIGLEDALHKELKFKWSQYFKNTPLPQCELSNGGIEITTELAQGLALNKILRGATRILLRLKSQKCRDYPKLFNILKKLNWKQFLRQENLEFSVSSSKSRLQNTNKIAQTAQDALREYFKANQIKRSQKLESASAQKIFLRLNEDLLTVSLDSSGELLHKRSNLSFRGHASLRENYAALCLWSLLDPNFDYSDYQLIDPMAGTGTFIREAINGGEIINRHFAFNNWHMIELPDLKQTINLWNFKKFQAFDNDPELKQKITDIPYETADFFNNHCLDQCLVIMNPPYGKRIKLKIPPIQYFKELLSCLQKNYKPTNFGVIIPQEFAKSLKGLNKLNFNQNGVKVNFISLLDN